MRLTLNTPPLVDQLGHYGGFCGAFGIRPRGLALATFDAPSDGAGEDGHDARILARYLTTLRAVTPSFSAS